MKIKHIARRRKQYRTATMTALFVAVSMALCFFMILSARAADQTAEAACQGGTCPSDPSAGGKIAHRSSDGTTTLRAQTYPWSGGYGHRIMRHVNKIHGSAALVEQLESQSVRIRNGSEAESGPEPGAVDAIRQTVLDIWTELTDQLFSLSMLHKEEWTQAVLELPPDFDVGGDPEKDPFARADDHFNKAVNAYEAALSVYSRMWRVMEPEIPTEAPAFSHYDRQAILARQSSANLWLSDLFHQRYNTLPSAATADDCSVAYGYLIRAESSGKRSLSMLGVALGGGGGDADVAGEKEAGHDAIVEEAKETMAIVQVRIGALLVDMYATGYVLDANGNLRLEPPAFAGPEAGPEEIERLGEGYERILGLSLEKLLKGSSILAELAAQADGRTATGRDYRLNVADARQYLGVVYGYLLRGQDAADEFEKSVSLYDELFRDYSKTGSMSEALDISSSIIDSTQKLFEAYSNLPGRTGSAKAAFRTHLAWRRFYEWQAPVEFPLTDDDDREENYEGGGTNRRPRLDYHSYDDDIVGVDPQNEELLKTYQTSLSEYLQQQSDYLPDGSYYEMEFEGYGENLASYVQHDQVYEGSLRSVIGSLQLEQNKLWEAKGELELAVGLLRDGLDGGRDTFEAYGQDGEIIDFSIKLEVANALLDLAYAQMGLKRWKSSYEAYQEAMDLYESNLAEGETPMNHSGGSNRGRTGWGDKFTRFFKETMGADDEAAGDETGSSNDAGDERGSGNAGDERGSGSDAGNERGSGSDAGNKRVSSSDAGKERGSSNDKEPSRYIAVENYQMMENSTYDRI